MKMPALFIPSSLTDPMRPVDLGDTSSLKPLRDLIGCSLVERVLPCDLVTEQLPPMALWIDEEGRCKNSPVLNVRASVLAGQEIYGNVVVCGEREYDIAPLNIPNAGRFLALLTMEAAHIQSLIDSGQFVPAGEI